MTTTPALPPPLTPPARRLMLVVSGDYGELGGALYFLQGLAMAEPPWLLLPPSANGLDARHTGGATVRHYRTRDDIEAALQAFRPDTVVLFSGYLLTIGARFSLWHALRLIVSMRRRGIRVWTSDPFLGQLRSPWTADFSDILAAQAQTPVTWRVRLWSRLLSLRVYVLERTLRPALHVYPAPVGAIGGDGRVPRAHYVSHVPMESAWPAVDGPPTWLFVLSRVDHAVLRRHAGADFDRALACRLREALGMGVQVRLIGPPELCDAVRRELGDEADSPSLRLDSEASYAAFTAAMMQANCAFFWNVYSFSILHRVLARRPVLFFDAGHMVGIVPSLHRVGQAMFYDGWTAPLMALDAPLDAGAVERRIAEAMAQFDRIARRLETGRTPGDLLGLTPP